MEVLKIQFLKITILRTPIGYHPTTYQAHREAQMSASGTPGGYRRPSPSIGERHQFHYHQHHRHAAPQQWSTLRHQPFSVQPDERITQATRHLHTSSTGHREQNGGSHLQFRRSNLEELPIDQLFEIIDHDHYYFDREGVGMHNGVDGAGYRNGGPGTSGMAVEPLETRLLKPGEHRRANRNAPIRRARQRIRNYCAML